MTATNRSPKEMLTDDTIAPKTDAIAVAIARALSGRPMQPVNGIVSLKHEISVSVDGEVWTVGLLGAFAVEVRKRDRADGDKGGA